MGDYLTPTASFTHPSRQEHIAVRASPCRALRGPPQPVRDPQALAPTPGKLDKLGMMNKNPRQFRPQRTRTTCLQARARGMKLIDHGYAFGGGLDSTCRATWTTHINGQTRPVNQARRPPPGTRGAGLAPGSQRTCSCSTSRPTAARGHERPRFFDRLNGHERREPPAPDMPRQHHLASRVDAGSP